MTVLDSFHPAVAGWFRRRFEAPTEVQIKAWEAVGEGRDTLVTAPTGSGKTLAAFLASIDFLVRQGTQANGQEADAIDVLYVSPLKALSSDVHRNLEEPLAGILEVAQQLGLEVPEIRTALRTGDTTAAERTAILRTVPHILVTTPESLYLLLTSERSRQILARGVGTVIVDELHALMRDKRGSHLALTLARLDALCPRRPVRVGLSATIHPVESAGSFLVGLDDSGKPLPCTIVNAGHRRDLDIAIEVPETELEAVPSNEQWSEIHNRIAELIRQHRTTLVFVNTRRLAERVAHQLEARLGEGHVAAHHGSLSKARRLDIEQRLKAGEMRAIVATASLELGIDIGSVDLVVQIGSPRAITTFLQRIGRSGHALGRISKGRLFATSRDELVECAALLRAVREGQLDPVEPPLPPLDILAQQIAAECASREWNEDELFALVRRTQPFAGLERSDFDDVITMLSEGPASRLGRGRALLHHDGIGRNLRGRRAARITALTCGGAIPETADYRVVMDPDETFLGTVNEDWAIESMAGDVFLLGSHTWRIRRVESGRGILRVEDAAGQAPNIPFWLGEAPGRTWMLSQQVSRLRTDVSEHLDPAERAIRWLEDEVGLHEWPARQLTDYVRAEKEALGIVPNHSDIVFERFFDDSGGMQLVAHAPFGSRVNRGLGLALRKRFCVTFDFELQAAASEDAVVLSLGPQHSFPLENAFKFVRSGNVYESLRQAVLPVPMFTTRWRWNATRSLMVLRASGGSKVPLPLQRMRCDDLLAAVFPAQVACQENNAGPIEIPDHPLVNQTMNDCLYEAIDFDRLQGVLEKMESGEIRLHARDTAEPSPFAHEILNSKPYTFLDDAPLEERRAQAVNLRRVLPEHQRDLGALDAKAIERVREEARPQPRDEHELHDTLLQMVLVQPDDEWKDWFDALVSSGRACRLLLPDGDRWFATEQLGLVRALHTEAEISPAVNLPSWLIHGDASVTEDEAAATALQGHLETLGPTEPEYLARRALGVRTELVKVALARLEGKGAVLRGQFTPGAKEPEVCDRRLLARIHRYTLDRLHREISAVSAQDFMRYLLERHGLTKARRREGKRGLVEVIKQLQGFEIPAISWERDILPMRMREYKPQWLDELCLEGVVTWARLSPNGADPAKRMVATRSTPVSLMLRSDAPWLLQAIRGDHAIVEPQTGAAGEVLTALRREGALYLDDLVHLTRRLPDDVQDGIWQLVSCGLVRGDGFGALRQIMRRARDGRNRRRSVTGGPLAPGRWSELRSFGPELGIEELAEKLAMQLLTRYGVVFRDLVAREDVAVPWREVIRALRRMEARGTVRGGRFVAGSTGEQYALPDAVEGLRRVRKTERTGEIALVSASDPLNLVGILPPGPRATAVHTKTVTFVDGAVADGSKSGNGNGGPIPVTYGEREAVAAG